MSVKKELTTGVFYTAFAKYSGMIISLVVVGILARILVPKDFGVVAVATVIISFFSTFSEMGIGPAIIQRKDLTKDDISSIFMLTVWIGIAISALFFIFSPLIGSYYNNPTLTNVCRLLSINLFFATLNIVPNGLVYRDKRFKYVASRTLVVQLTTGVIAIASVFWGAGIYALTINPTLSALLIFILNYKQYPQKIHLSLQRDSLKKIAGYSTYQFLFNVLNYFGKNMDKLIIGRTIGMTPLGYYEKSYQLMMLPLQNISNVLGPVLHPVFSDMQKDKKSMILSYEKVLHLLAYIGFPLSVFLFFTAKEITLLLFGSQWMPAVPVFQLFSITVGIQILLSTTGAMFQAGNDTKYLFYSGLFTFFTNISAICVGVFVFESIEKIAIFLDLAFLLQFFQVYLTIYKISFKTPMGNFWKQLSTPCIVSVVLLIVLFIASPPLSDLNILISLGIKIVLSSIVLLAYTQVSGEYNLKELYNKRKRRVR